MAEPSRPEDEIDALYGLRPGEFVGARDALAKRLRADGQPDAADAVRKLARPTVAAWAINALVRDEPEWTQALVTAGRRLEEAQQALVEHGDRDRWREANAAQRAAVDRLARLAEDLVREERGSVSAAVRDAIRETLHAATIDAGARDEVCAGRLAHELRAVGLLGGDLTAAAVPRPTGRTPAPAARSRRSSAGAQAQAEAARRAAAEQGARDALRRAEREASSAEAAAKRAAQGAERAAKAHAAAESALAEAQDAAERRGAELADAQQAERDAQNALEAAQTAVHAAQADLDRALSQS
ncbi:hypothetical protein DSM104329_01017 [Capillimicrobium parvum]|uniref:Uncharacterized protein n=2 Tax=Capillimicrobium parvum TaxID=2884022 RepID=A0A9E6XUF5_9ACTN|nr:hypothetical protein DSM104329_01017 [Capillimicrobium parvum]